MKHFISSIIAVLLLSCSADKKVEKKLISEFKTILGKRESKQLDDIVRDFDAFLNNNYKSKNSELRLKQYLEEIANGDNQEFWKIDEVKLKEYHTSNLFAKYDSIYPDSVWIENDFINIKYKDSEVTQSIIPINKSNLDSMVNELKKEPELNQTSPGSFMLALESIAPKDSQIINYLDAKEIAGGISLYMLANGLLHNYKTRSEYFTKRIFVMEMND
uniref:hypothetical protein n=1 Tax=uncultured Draconibacterium sp. TaxID=1573823 RepID=UPI00321662F5